MIHLTTGLPGNGKTLFTIAKVRERAEKEHRPVFYSGIADLTLGWTRLDDVKAWHKCPPGSIIVIDEAQRELPPRGQGAVVPEFVQAFAVHRHQGFDVYLITQDGMMFDHFVRRLVNVFWHVVRPFGLQYATVWQWERFGQWDDYHFRKEAQKFRFTFPRELFGVYRSAEVHTHKRRLPWRRFAVLGALLAVVGVGAVVAWFTVARMDSNGAGAATAKKEGIGILPGVMPSGVGLGSKAAPQSVGEYVKARQPRVPALPESAPVYDEIAKPVVFPRIAACWRKGEQCQCFTQQATPLYDVPRAVCFAFVVNGAFDPYRAEAVAAVAKPVPAEQRPAPQGPDSARGGLAGDEARSVPGPISNRPAELGTLRVVLGAEAQEKPAKESPR